MSPNFSPKLLSFRVDCALLSSIVSRHQRGVKRCFCFSRSREALRARAWCASTGRSAGLQWVSLGSDIWVRAPRHRMDGTHDSSCAAANTNPPLPLRGCLTPLVAPQETVQRDQCIKPPHPRLSSLTASLALARVARPFPKPSAILLPFLGDRLGHH